MPTLSAMATMFAVPPIQLPESAAKPIQASSGRNAPKRRSAIGAPRTMPAVPATTMISAIRPRRAMLPRSTETIRSRSATGRR